MAWLQILSCKILQLKCKLVLIVFEQELSSRLIQLHLLTSARWIVPSCHCCMGEVEYQSMAWLQILFCMILQLRCKLVLISSIRGYRSHLEQVLERRLGQHILWWLSQSCMIPQLRCKLELTLSIGGYRSHQQQVLERRLGQHTLWLLSRSCMIPQLRCRLE